MNLYEKLQAEGAARALESTQRAYASASVVGDSQYDASGLTLRIDDKGRGLWAEVGAKDPAAGRAAYSWQEVEGEGGDVIGALEGGLGGLYDGTGNGAAFEVNGNLTVPSGTRVWAWPARDGKWLFEFAGNAAGGSVTYGDGDTVTHQDGSEVVYQDGSTTTYEGDSVIVYDGPDVSYSADTVITLASGVDLTINGPGFLIIGAGLTVNDWFAWGIAKPPQITANQNDYALPDATVVLFATDARRTVTGFATTARDGADVPRFLIAVNAGSSPLVFTHQDTASTARNRFDLPGGSPLALSPDDSALFQYDTDGDRWRVISTTADIARQQSAAVSTNQNDYALSDNGGSLVLECTSASDLTGIANGYDGRLLAVTNSGTQTLTLKDSSASSSGSNRFDFAAGADLALAAGQSVLLVYDGAADRWRDVGPKSGASSGGGGTTGDSGTATMAGPYNTTTTLADVGLTAAMPATGTYLFTVTLELSMDVNTNGSTISVRLTNFTTGATRETYVPLSSVSTTNNNRAAVTITDVFSANAADSIRVQARHTTMGTVTTSQVVQGRLSYVRLS